MDNNLSKNNNENLEGDVEMKVLKFVNGNQGFVEDLGLKLKPSEILIGLEKDNIPVVVDLNKDNHLLLTGSPGTGMTFTIKNIVNTLVENNDANDLEFYFIQADKEDLSLYKSLESCKECITPHYYETTLELMTKAEETLKELRDTAYDRSIAFGNTLDDSYKGPLVDDMPYILLAIDNSQALFTRDYNDKRISDIQKECREHIYAINKLSRNVKIKVVESNQRIALSYFDDDITSVDMLIRTSRW